MKIALITVPRAACSRSERPSSSNRLAAVIRPER